MRPISNDFPLIYPQYSGDIFREFYSNCGFYIELPYHLFVVNEKKYQTMINIEWLGEHVKVDALNMYKNANHIKGYNTNLKLGRYFIFTCDNMNLLSRDDPNNPSSYFQEVLFPYFSNPDYYGISLCDTNHISEEIIIIFEKKDLLIQRIFYIPNINEWDKDENGNIYWNPESGVSEEFKNDYQQSSLGVYFYDEDITEKNISNNIVLNVKLLIEEYSNKGIIYPIYYDKTKILELII